MNDSPLIGEETRGSDPVDCPSAQLPDQHASPSFELAEKPNDCLRHPCLSQGFLGRKPVRARDDGWDLSGLARLEYDLLVIHVDPNDTKWAHQYFDTGRVDGFILMTATRKQSHVKALLDLGAPFIIWGVPQPRQNCCSVTGDNFNGGKLATEHLLGIGRHKIGFIGGPSSEIEVQHRQAGYESALQEAGIDIDKTVIDYGDFSNTSGAEAMKRLLERVPEIDGVFVNSDLMAIAAMDVVREAGRRVPEDVAVVGYDDLSIAEHSNPPLTTIRQNIPLAGKLLAQNLIDYLQTGMVTNVSIPVELIVRKSA